MQHIVCAPSTGKASWVKTKHWSRHAGSGANDMLHSYLPVEPQCLPHRQNSRNSNWNSSFSTQVQCLVSLVNIVDGAKILSLLHSFDRYIDQDFNYYSNVTYDIVLDVANDEVFIIFAKKKHHWRGNNYLKSCIKESKRIKKDTKYKPSLATIPLAAHVFVSSLLYGDMPRKCWPVLSSEFHQKKYSQTGQDGVLEYIFNNIGATNRYYVEFGYPNKKGGKQGSNTENLRLHHNFTGLLMDREYSSESINLHKETITAENIISLFEKYKVPLAPDYVSIDIDSMDLWVFRSVVSSKYRPRVITVEYNMNYPMNSTLTCALKCHWTGCRHFGTSIGALNLVAEEFKYTLVSVLPQTDAFYIRNEELNDSTLILPSLKYFEDNFGINYLKRCSIKHGDDGRHFVESNVVDYRAWRVAGNITYARIKALEQLEIMRLYQNIEII